MIVQKFNENQLLIGCDDQELLQSMQARMDGKKVYRKNQIIIHKKASPKIFRFCKPEEVIWKDDTFNLVDSISREISERKKTIQNIKDEYGYGVQWDYECHGQYPPLEHQKIMFKIMINSNIGAMLADPGTCKTAAYLWAIDYRKSIGEIKRALVVTMPDLRKNVIDEMRIQVPHLKGIILKDKARCMKIINKDCMYMLVEIFADDYFDMIVLDEAHRIGNPSSRQTKRIVEKFEFCKYKYIVTGTLNSNNLMSFFMPYRFMGPDTVPYADYRMFRRAYMFPVDEAGYIWKPHPASIPEVSKMISNVAVHFKKEDCIDLPDLIFEKFYCNLEGEQESAYIGMAKYCLAEIEDVCNKCDRREGITGECNGQCDGTIMSKNVLANIIKLRQISCGFYKNTKIVVDENGKEKNESNTISFKENPKLDLLLSVIGNWTHSNKYRHSKRTNTGLCQPILQNSELVKMSSFLIIRFFSVIHIPMYRETSQLEGNIDRDKKIK